MSGNVFDSMKEGQEKPETPEKSNAAEIHKFKIIKPGVADEAEYCLVVNEAVDEAGITRSSTHPDLVTACGKLCSYDTEGIRHKAPAGVCKNPRCGALLCDEHIGEGLRCFVCGVQVCRECGKQFDDSFLCAEHYGVLREGYERERLEKLKSRREGVG